MGIRISMIRTAPKFPRSDGVSKLLPFLSPTLSPQGSDERALKGRKKAGTKTVFHKISNSLASVIV